MVGRCKRKSCSCFPAQLLHTQWPNLGVGEIAVMSWDGLARTSPPFHSSRVRAVVPPVALRGRWGWLCEAAASSCPSPALWVKYAAEELQQVE